MLVVAILAHVWLVHAPRPADGVRLAALVSTAVSSIAVSRAVDEPSVTLIHEDVIAAHVGTEQPPVPSKPEPEAHIVRRAVREIPRDGEPVGTSGVPVARGDVARLEPAMGTAATLTEPVPPVLKPAAIDAGGTLPEIPDVAPLPPVVLSRDMRPDAAAARPLLPPASPRATPADAIGDLKKQEQVVLQIVRDYTRAYERMDVRAAKALWPSLDDRALQRAFEQLDAQQLRFPSCGVSITGQGANARCKGDATYRPKVGTRVLRLTERVWTFNLSRSDDGWQIVDARIQ
ncbi:MAG: hypothetical protein ACRD15_14345 [Vicinamibacterales bacterium]